MYKIRTAKLYYTSRGMDLCILYSPSVCFSLRKRPMQSKSRCDVSLFSFFRIERSGVILTAGRKKRGCPFEAASSVMSRNYRIKILR
jgi:hypothetical protein